MSEAVKNPIPTDLDEIRKYIDKTARFVVQYMIENNMSISTAESCTGGLLSGAITSAPGASKIFECGIVSYSVRIKEKLLGVPKEIIDEHGVVSGECAREMSRRVKAISGSDISVGITGLAGPGGDGELPEGTIFVSIDHPGGNFTENLELNRFGELGRAKNRLMTVAAVLCKLKEIFETR